MTSRPGSPYCGFCEPPTRRASPHRAATWRKIGRHGSSLPLPRRRPQPGRALQIEDTRRAEGALPRDPGAVGGLGRRLRAGGARLRCGRLRALGGRHPVRRRGAGAGRLPRLDRLRPQRRRRPRRGGPDTGPARTRGQIIMRDHEQDVGGDLLADSLTDLVSNGLGEGRRGPRGDQPPAVARVNIGGLSSVEAAAHPELEVLSIGVWEGEPLSLAPVTALRSLGRPSKATSAPWRRPVRPGGSSPRSPVRHNPFTTPIADRQDSLVKKAQWVGAPILDHQGSGAIRTGRRRCTRTGRHHHDPILVFIVFPHVILPCVAP